jgi:Undecaprenyl-phosphate galactose phosphotransferase WbaP
MSKTLILRILYPIFIVIGDLTGFYLSLIISYFLRIHFWDHWISVPLSQSFGIFLRQFWIPFILLGVFLYEGLYSRRQPFWEETQHLVRAIFLAFVAVFAFVSLGKLSSVISRLVILENGLFSLFLIPLFRYWWKPFLHRTGIGVKKTVLVGEGEWGSLANLGLYRDHYMGIKVIGRISLPDEYGSTGNGEEKDLVLEDFSLSGEVAPPLSDLGSLSDLKEIVRDLHIRGAVIATPHLRRQEISQLVSYVQRYVLSVYVVPNISQVNLVNSELLYLFYEEIFLLGLHNNLKSRANRFIKSLSDFILALILVVPLTPVMTVIALVIAASSPGPVFYSQYRMGQKGKLFSIFKFRTMVLDADKKLNDLLARDPEMEKEFREKYKLEKDPRITAIGRFLRKTSLDELPQIINVLRGEMSFVGPRPVTRDELHFLYREASEEYSLVKPGITGLWQVSGRSERGYEVRIRLDVWYIRNWSLWLDFVILIRTIGVVFSGRGSW